MPKQKKLSKDVLDELEANPNISESMLEAARCARFTMKAGNG